VSPIHLHLDHAHILILASDHILGEAIADYVPAYAQMVEALHADQPITIVVRHPTCAAWLETARQKYGPQRVQVTAVTPWMVNNTTW
jgi:hypothetical protein